jgi:hypothetical protein
VLHDHDHDRVAATPSAPQTHGVLNTDIPPVQPTRSAITVAGILGVINCSRIAGSNWSTADLAGSRAYFGGPSKAIAARTVHRETPTSRRSIGSPTLRNNSLHCPRLSGVESLQPRWVLKRWPRLCSIRNPKPLLGRALKRLGPRPHRVSAGTADAD